MGRRLLRSGMPCLAAVLLSSAIAIAESPMRAPSVLPPIQPTPTAVPLPAPAMDGPGQPNAFCAPHTLNAKATFVPVELLPDWPRWYAGATGLLMTRTLPSGVVTSVLPGQGAVLTTSAAGATWPGGVDLHLGRWLDTRQERAIEAGYWGVYGIGSTGAVTDPANHLQAVPQAPDVLVGGTPASAFLQHARAQEIDRSDLVNSVEINWAWAPGGRPEFFVPGDGLLTLTWLAGFRFFELQDVLGFTSLAGGVPPGATFGANGGASQLGLNVATNNNIYGAQIGGQADWHLLPALRLSVVKKFMFGGNSITNTSSMASGNGVTAMFPGGTPVQVHSTASAFSYLGQLDAGLAWDVTRNWSLSMGCRIVGLANIAQSDASWPRIVASPGSLSHINAAGSTFLHGGFAGFEGRY